MNDEPKKRIHTRKNRMSAEGKAKLRENLIKARAARKQKPLEERQAEGRKMALKAWAKRGRKPVAGRKYFRVGFAPDLLDHIETNRGEQSITDYIDPVLAKGFGIPRGEDEPPAGTPAGNP